MSGLLIERRPVGGTRLERLCASWWALGALVLAMLAIHLHSLGVAPLAGTEGHRVVTAHQMLQRGEYLVPKLYGFNYLLKPPLYYWILAGFEAVFGASKWVWRMPGVLAHVAVLCLCFVFGRRWFGAVAGSVAGLGMLLMICLWQEARTADIDGVNTLASTAAVLVLAEVLFRDPTRKALWVLAGIAAFGAALLLKLPAVLPALVIPLIGAAIVRGWRGLLRWELAAILIGGVLVFLCWAIPLYFAIRGSPTVMDTEGANQGIGKLFPHSISAVAQAAVFPLVMLAFSLPAAVGLLLVFHRSIWSKRKDAGSAEQMMVALGAGALGSWVLCLFSGMDNPRYAYVTVPTVAVVAGGAFVRAYREARGPGLARWTMLVMAGGLVVAAGVATAQAGRLKVYGPVGLEVWISLGMLLVIAAVTAYGLMRRGALARGAVGLVLMAILLGIPFSTFSDRRRDTRSGIHAAAKVAKLLPDNAPVVVGALLYYQPEFFWYLNHPTTAVGRRALMPAGKKGEKQEKAGARVDITPGTIYLVDRDEVEMFRSLPAGTVAREVMFVSNGQKCYLVETSSTARNNDR